MSEVFIVYGLVHCISNVFVMETSILHEAYLPRPLVERARPGLELLRSHFACELRPLIFIRFDLIGDQAHAHSPFAEFIRDAFRTKSAVRPNACICLGKTAIAQYIFPLEFIERGLDYRFFEPLRDELSLQLEAAVLAASECSNRQFARRRLVPVSQASASMEASSESAGSATFSFGIVTERISLSSC